MTLFLDFRISAIIRHLNATQPFFLEEVLKQYSHCYVDESIQESIGLVTTAFVFSDDKFHDDIRDLLIKCGIDVSREEFKSSARMDSDPRMKQARDELISLTRDRAKIAVFFGHFYRPNLAKQSLQALQSVLLRNGIPPSSLSVYFDQEIFSSHQEAIRLHGIFHFLKECKIFPKENSKTCFGVQSADVVAYCFGKIAKAAITGEDKEIDVGGEETGYPEGDTAPLSWSLLMSLRYALLTRPVICSGKCYDVSSDPVILDPQNDDVVDYAQNPVLLGWGVQIDPKAAIEVRCAIEKELGTIWLGCIH